MYDIINNKYGQEADSTSIIDSMQSGVNCADVHCAHSSILQLECCGVHTYRDWLHSYFAHGQAGSIGQQVDIGIGSSVAI